VELLAPEGTASAVESLAWEEMEDVVMIVLKYKELLVDFCWPLRLLWLTLHLLWLAVQLLSQPSLPFSLHGASVCLLLVPF
jgi:hypothetical protein